MEKQKIMQRLKRSAINSSFVILLLTLAKTTASNDFFIIYHLIWISKLPKTLFTKILKHATITMMMIVMQTILANNFTLDFLDCERDFHVFFFSTCRMMLEWPVIGC